ncbi:hypothetical protein FWD20_01085 [Candidatus Saccharibacteria bacterium]|nr:hypothetical protein [Candidatus Saccharibacteria bacterium]
MYSFASRKNFEFEVWHWPSAGVVAGIVCGALLLYVLTAFLLARLFRKAGVPTWKAWVPLYNLWKFFQIGGRVGVWSLLLPVVILSAAALALFVGDCGYKHDWQQTNEIVTLVSLLVILILATVAYVAQYIAAVWSITKKLDKNLVYLLLLFVNLGPSLWLWIMALDKSKWNDKLGSKSLAPEMKKKDAKKKK